MGLGTARFPIKNAADTAGIEKTAQLVLEALKSGINYIDTSYPYSGGGAHKALNLAFKQAKSTYSVTVKVIYQSDKTGDEARRRVESQLESLGISKTAFLLCWSIPSYEQFTEIMRKGGVYEGALKLKDEGIIDHICCSLHAPANDSIRIIESGVFEAVTVSFNFTNAMQTIPILDAALKHDVDVAVMNPLGGGGIVQNSSFFSFAQTSGENIVSAALCFAKSHPAVKVVLSGLSNVQELEENLQVVTKKNVEPDSERMIRVINKVKDIDGFCVNCHYCDGCPAQIPVSELMDKHNRLLFGTVSTQDYRRSDEELLQNINLFYGQAQAESDHGWFPISPVNPCIQCGECEKKCTQKLNIIKSIDDIYKRADKCGFSLQAREIRIKRILHDKGYKKVGLYPKDRFADMVIKLYEMSCGSPTFDWLAFNSDPTMWGRESDGLTVHAPSSIEELKPDVIIVCNYTYQEEIYTDLQRFIVNGIKIIKLHNEADIPWVF